MVYIFVILLVALMVWFRLNEAKIKGGIGEKYVSTLLHTLDPEKYILFNDLYIPKENGQTTQIDHIVLSHKGIFVIETKNYKGWITGKEGSQNWTQTNYKRKFKFYNPIWQNSGHIQALKDYLGDSFADTPIYSIIAFSSRATLKFNLPFKNAKVIYIQNLLSTIKEVNGENAINHFNLQKLKYKLAKLKIKDKQEQKEQAKKHIADIKSELNKKQDNINNNICPRCGSQLVIRNGKRGTFKGCSSFPKCRFIA